MWTKLRSRTVVPHDRNNCATWSTLDPDLLVIVAKHCDATSVCRLSQACTEWRDAVARQAEQIWKPLVRADFRRTASLLEAFPPEAGEAGFSYATLYREQLKAERTELPQSMRMENTCALNHFLFTLELVTTGDTRRVVEEWSGTLDPDDGHVTIPIDLREWRATWDWDWRDHHGGRIWRVSHVAGTTPMSLEVFVSKCEDWGDSKALRLSHQAR